MSETFAVYFILPFSPPMQSGTEQAATYSSVVLSSIDDDSFSRSEPNFDMNAQREAYLSLELFLGTWEGSCQRNYLP